MVKRMFLVGGVLLLLSTLLTGCVVLKSDYEVVVAERDATLADLQSTKNELNSAQAEVSSLKTEVSNLKAQVSDLNSNLEKRLRQISDAEQALNSLEPKLEMYGLLAEYGHKQAWYRATEGALSWSEFSSWARGTFRPDVERLLDEIGDSSLRVLYEDAIVWQADGWTIYHQRYAQLLTKLGDLILDDVSKLRTASAG